ncbi:MAG: amidase [Solirubrobacteraceae bacterium]|nr:amidase [Solirubrobacteraceae bacterium]
MPETEVRRIPRTSQVFSYSADHGPWASIAPGETVLVETTNAFGDQPLAPGDTLADLDLAAADPLTGPLYVEGAEPGDSIAVHIEHIKLIGTGAQGIIPGFGTLDWERLPLHFFEPKDGRIRWLRGIEIEVRPSLGAMGVAPARGSIPSIEPGDHGGNQDCKYVCAGSAIHFPVFHPGALLFLGDCHQIQGDGELCGVAPETDAEVTLHVELLKGRTIRRPRIMSAERFMTLASAKTLEDAVKLATRDAVDLLVEEKGLTEDEAYLLITIKADVEICQVVDPLMTVRVAMDRDFFERLAPEPR